MPTSLRMPRRVPLVAQDVVAVADTGHLEAVTLQRSHDSDARDRREWRHQAATVMVNSRGTPNSSMRPRRASRRSSSASSSLSPSPCAPTPGRSWGCAHRNHVQRSALDGFAGSRSAPPRPHSTSHAAHSEASRSAVSSRFWSAWMALTSRPTQLGQQRSLRRIRQVSSWASARSPGPRSRAWARLAACSPTEG
jgi:hypothetical protein